MATATNFRAHGLIFWTLQHKWKPAIFDGAAQQMGNQYNAVKITIKFVMCAVTVPGTGLPF